MTKKKIAQPKPRTKRTAAQRITSSDAQQKNSHTGVQTGPVDAEIRRAAERAGIPVPLTEAQQARQELKDRLRDEFSQGIAPNLLLACEQLSEEVAAIAAAGGTSDDNANVVDALLSLWKIRWELGLTPKHVTEQAAGGAS
jgi:hypothetical protein